MAAVQNLVIVGAGGFARELAWAVDEINRIEPKFALLGFVVSDLGALGERDTKDRLLGDFSWLEANHRSIDAIAIGIGTPQARHRVAREIEAAWPDFEWPPIIHPSVIIDRGSAKIGRGAVFCPGVVATVNVAVGDFPLLNLNCTLGHESSIGRAAVINPGANISGGVTIANQVLVGTGAQILQYRRIGEAATVGAGAVVTRDVPPHTTVVGVPARVLDRRAR